MRPQRSWTGPALYASRRSTAWWSWVPALLLLAGCATGRVRDRIAEQVREAHLPPSIATTEPSAPDADDLDPAGGLPAYLRRGLTASPRLRAAVARWQRALWRGPQAGGMPDPELTVSVFAEHLETRTGAQRARVLLAQRFPWFGKRALRSAVADQRAAVAWQEVIRVRAGLEREIARAFHDYAYLGGTTVLVRDELRLLRSLEPIVVRRQETGGGQGDLLRLQMEVGKLENRLATLEARQPVLDHRLRALLVLAPGDPLPFPGPTTATPEKLDRPALAAALRADNPELTVLRARVTAAESAIARELREGYPDLTLGVGWFETAGSEFGDPPDSGRDPVAVNLGLNLPVWRSKYTAGVEEARADRRAAQESLHDRELALTADLAALIFAVEDARRRERLFDTTLIPRAERALAAARAAYRTGAGRLWDLIDRERELLGFRETVLAARTDAARARADLRALLGKELP